jgi:hypothetical protein
MNTVAKGDVGKGAVGNERTWNWKKTVETYIAIGGE